MRVCVDCIHDRNNAFFFLLHARSSRLTFFMVLWSSPPSFPLSLSLIRVCCARDFLFSPWQLFLVYKDLTFELHLIRTMMLFESFISSDLFELLELLPDLVCIFAQIFFYIWNKMKIPLFNRYWLRSTYCFLYLLYWKIDFRDFNLNVNIDIALGFIIHINFSEPNRVNLTNETWQNVFRSIYFLHYTFLSFFFSSAHKFFLDTIQRLQREAYIKEMRASKRAKANITMSRRNCLSWGGNSCQPSRLMHVIELSSGYNIVRLAFQKSYMFVLLTLSLKSSVYWFLFGIEN